MHELTEETIDEFKELEDFNPFSLPQIRTFVQVYSYYKRAKIPIESILKKYDAWLVRLQKILNEDPLKEVSDAINEAAVSYCPECNTPMDLLNVENLKGKDNLFNWKSVLSCRNCGHEEFSKESYAIRAERRIERMLLKKRELMPGLPSRKKDDVRKLVCPVCNGPLKVISILAPKGKTNKKGYRSLAQCVVCTYEDYSTVPAGKRARKMIKAQMAKARRK